MEYIIQEFWGYVDLYYLTIIYSTKNIHAMLFLLVNICLVCNLVLSVYLLKTRVSEVDRALDSIETSTAINKWNYFRLLEYAFLFCTPKARSKEYQEKINILNQNFDAKFQRPFKFLTGVFMLGFILLVTFIIMVWLQYE